MGRDEALCTPHEAQLIGVEKQAPGEFLLLQDTYHAQGGSEATVQTGRRKVKGGIGCKGTQACERTLTIEDQRGTSIFGTFRGFDHLFIPECPSEEFTKRL
jgi:hypothetical protein